MKRSCLASLGLTLGLLVGSACAQDIQWRAVAPTPAVSPQPAANAGSSSAAVILRSPVAMTTDASAAPPSLTQTSFTASAPVWARAKLLQEEPLPLPVGPVLKGDKQPPTNPVQQPSAAWAAWSRALSALATVRPKHPAPRRIAATARPAAIPAARVSPVAPIAARAVTFVAAGVGAIGVCPGKTPSGSEANICCGRSRQ
jgi:hypothetical protein